MTTEAWIMLLITWTISLGFTSRFLFIALTRPAADGNDNNEDDS